VHDEKVDGLSVGTGTVKIKTIPRPTDTSKNFDFKPKTVL